MVWVYRRQHAGGGFGLAYIIQSGLSSVVSVAYKRGAIENEPHGLHCSTPGVYLSETFNLLPSVVVMKHLVLLATVILMMQL